DEAGRLRVPAGRKPRHLLLHRGEARRLPRPGEGPGLGVPHEDRAPPDRRARRSGPDRRGRNVWPRALLRHVAPGIRADHAQDGERPGTLSQPLQDLGRLRAPQVLPPLRARLLQGGGARIPQDREQAHASGRRMGGPTRRHLLPHASSHRRGWQGVVGRALGSPGGYEDRRSEPGPQKGMRQIRVCLPGDKARGRRESGARTQAAAVPLGELMPKFYLTTAIDYVNNIPHVGTAYEKIAADAIARYKRLEGYYCVGCERFYPEKDLVDKKCPIHQTVLERLSEDNYFFKLSKYGPPLLRHIREHPEFIIPEIRRNEIVNVIEGGLEDISVSRSSGAWGIPFPIDSGQTVYVWFDALINYISGVGYPESNGLFSRYWPADLHVIGKDITRFHCVIWPAMLMSAGVPL